MLCTPHAEIESAAAWYQKLGGFTPSYILHTRALGTYLLGGLFTLQKWLQGDDILHVKSLKIFYVMVFYM